MTNHAPCKYANEEVGGTRKSASIDNMSSRQKIIGERLLRVESALNNLKKDAWDCDFVEILNCTDQHWV